MSKSKVLFMLSGSIAAFKAAQAISKLVQDGLEVQTVATPSALQFIGPSTLEGLTGRKPLSDLWEPGQAMEHINLTRWADIAVLCPASANSVAKIAHGFGDDLIGALTLAWPLTKPFQIFPAMNSLMLAAPATQANLRTLQTRGYWIAPTGSGSLACGEEGEGRLAEAEEIVRAIKATLARSGEAAIGEAPRRAPSANAPSANAPSANASSAHAAAGAFAGAAAQSSPPIKRGRILVTAGATREPIDGIRFISNVSTGQTGSALADQLSARGWQVTYLHGQGAAKPQNAAHTISFGDHRDLDRKLKLELDQRDYAAVIHSAAVSDYSIENPDAQVKLSSEYDMTLHLKRNPKLLPLLKRYSRNKAIKVIGFKLTLNATDGETEQKASDLLSENVDAVVANDWAQVNRDRSKHPGMLVSRDGILSFRTVEELATGLHERLSGGAKEKTHDLMS